MILIEKLLTLETLGMPNSLDIGNVAERLALEAIKQLLAEGLVIIDNVDNPTLPEHHKSAYCSKGLEKLLTAGKLVHKLTPALHDMIKFAKEYVPEQHLNTISHAWSGIGKWQA